MQLRGLRSHPPVIAHVAQRKAVEIRELQADAILPISALARALIGPALILISGGAAGAVDDRDEFVRIVQVSRESIHREVELGEPVSRHHLRDAEQQLRPRPCSCRRLLLGQRVVAARHRRAADRMDRVIFVIDAEGKRGVLFIEIVGDRGVHRGGEEIILRGQLAAHGHLIEPGEWHRPVSADRDPVILVVGIHGQLTGSRRVLVSRLSGWR